jgi:hypothetical protein
LENISFEDVKEILDKEESESSKSQPGSNSESGAGAVEIAVAGAGAGAGAGLASNIIRQVSNNISVRSGKFGDYIFYKTPKMKKPMFSKIGGFKGDYKNCHIDILKNWIKQEYGFS